MSWRTYGGVRKQDNLKNITVGTIVADQILLREKYSGIIDFKSSITVQGTTLTSQLVSKQNIYSLFDTNVGQDLYVNRKLYFGITYADFAAITSANYGYPLTTINTNAYIFGNSKSIGINTQAASAVFEINATTSADTDILTVGSQTTTTRSIIAQTVSKRGVVVTANTGSSMIDFFNDVSTDKTNTYNARIQYQTGGTLSINSTNNRLVSSQNNYSISSNTQIQSKLQVSNRSSGNIQSSLLNETASIYDTSNGYYKYDYYENTKSNTGNALTIVGVDTSSTSLLNIVTSNKKGLGIGGGAYPNNMSQSMGSIGLTDICGNYTPIQTIVSGSNTTKYNATIGINTYSPRTDNYILDVNGPLHIANGEINKTASFDFEIMKSSFSKISPNVGIAAGSPSPISTNTYPQYIGYTKDYGKTWYQSQIINNVTSGLEETYNNMVCNMYDSSFGIVATNNNYMFYTMDGGANWQNIIVTESGYYNYNHRITNLSCAYVDGVNVRVFISFYISATNVTSSNQVLYFDVIDYKSINKNSFIEVIITKSNMSTTNMLHSDANSNSIYFVGNGIEKRSVRLFSDASYSQTNYLYNHICVYDTSYAIAVGVNIISYTKDNGTNWTNKSISATLKSVYIYSSLIAVAVGENGVVMYTSDGCSNWSVVPNEILNTSGISSVINGANTSLRDIIMPDINSLLITSAKTIYNSSNTTNGLSKIYYCFIPNLFNRTGNNVLDICGNMTIDGDITIRQGNLNISTSTFSFANNVTTLSLGNDASNVYIGNSIVRRIGIATASANSKYSLDISGIVNTNGCIFQF